MPFLNFYDRIARPCDCSFRSMSLCVHCFSLEYVFRSETIWIKIIYGEIIFIKLITRSEEEKQKESNYANCQMSFLPERP